MPALSPNDARSQIEAMRNALLRQAGTAKRAQLAFELSTMVWNGVRMAVDRVHATEDQDKRDEIFLAQLYGRELARRFVAFRHARGMTGGPANVGPDEIRQACLITVQALERLGIPYALGGSLASAIHGVYRATADADLVVEMKPAQAKAFCDLLEGKFYFEFEAIAAALRKRRTFNIIYVETMMKVDLYPLKETPFDHASFARRQQIPFFAPGAPKVWCSSAEDTILHKLAWFEQGGRVSDRQWSDVLGVWALNRGNLDEVYLRTWAERLNLAALLQQAIEEAG